jgi:hypothetical protein
MQDTHRIPPLIPRAEWSQHPNFPTQALLLGSHANFRAISEHLMQSARQRAPIAPISSLYRRWKAAIEGHEAYEERKLYPYLERRWGVSFADAVAGHELLHARDREVRDALRTGVGVAETLAAHHTVLVEHLDLEETLVIPLLLELSPAEFALYSLSPPA